MVNQNRLVVVVVATTTFTLFQPMKIEILHNRLQICSQFVLTHHSHDKLIIVTKKNAHNSFTSWIYTKNVACLRYCQSSNYIVEFCITNLLTRQLDLPLLISRGQKDNRQNSIQTHFFEETPLHDQVQDLSLLLSPFSYSQAQGSLWMDFPNSFF